MLVPQGLRHPLTLLQYVQNGPSWYCTLLSYLNQAARSQGANSSRLWLQQSSWSQSDFLLGRMWGLSSSSPYPLGHMSMWLFHQSIIHSYEMSRCPIFHKCSKWAIKSTGIKSFVINDTSAQGTRTEMMDTEKRELKRKVSINLKPKIVQPSGKWMGLFIREPDVNPPVQEVTSIKCLFLKFVEDTEEGA